MKAKYIAPKIDIMECEADAILYGSIEKKEITINVIPNDGDAAIEIGDDDPLGGGVILDAKKGWGASWDDEDDF